MERSGLAKSVAIIAGIVLGYTGSFSDLWKVSRVGPSLAVVGGIFVIILIFLEVSEYLDGSRTSFKEERETWPYMCNVVSQSSPAIFSVRMSYTEREDVREVLRRRAEAGDLTIYLPRMIPFAEELRRLGATVKIYAENLDWIPQSRFTFVRHTRHDAELYFGHSKGDRFIIERFKASDDDPAYWLARDLIELINKFELINKRIPIHGA
jgi:hypothetical protein